jgi:hypothetical protein
MMFRDTQWINITTKRTKSIKKKRIHADSASDTSTRSDNDEMSANSEFYDPLPPSGSKELRNIEGGEYFLPSADKNIERLQMQHFLFRCVWASNHSAPTEDIFASGGAKVLDVQ